MAAANAAACDSCVADGICIVKPAVFCVAAVAPRYGAVPSDP